MGTTIAGVDGTQSIERAIALLLAVGRAGPEGARPTDLVTESGLPKPTVRRVLKALVRSGLLDQDDGSRRYHIGPEAYVLGLLAGARFGIHAMSLGGLARLSQATGDSAFLSVPRDTYSVCLHREEGSFPLRTHVLQMGDRHPLGVGAGSLAILSMFPDDEVERILEANTAILSTELYKSYSPKVMRELVARTRRDGYAFNPGMLMPGSWGLGVGVRGPDGRPAGALSIAAIERRFDDARAETILPFLQEEAARLEQRLRQPDAEPRPRQAKP
ncbi:IclR family transcriptional regulator [Sphingomonas sp. MG17]|uniref:IclR family transcriptional regulator n=1 Tax=Sphingomonas tagetis TaxID=2949092 RepID=A0A9X2HLC8_9SPHN|nr:IclR family transcriptional regulator [Sphingomonas tagetis]